MSHAANSHGGFTNRELGICEKPARAMPQPTACPNCMGAGRVSVAGGWAKCSECTGPWQFEKRPEREAVAAMVEGAKGWRGRHLAAMAEHAHEVAEGVGAQLEGGK